MHSLFALLTLPILSTALSIPDIIPQLSSPQAPLLDPLTAPKCDCTNTNSSGPRNDPPSICNDWRLGPAKLPRRLPLLSLVSDYDRFGGETPGEFLARWTNQTTGDWLWPEQFGFSVDLSGKPILGNMTLKAGTKVDRFGAETGRYVSAADAPYDQRSLPPSSLNTAAGGPGDYPYGYHIYHVLQDFVVEGGPIAPWFGQPGLGAQFYVGGTGTVAQLIQKNILRPLNKTEVVIGPGNGKKCGM